MSCYRKCANCGKEDYGTLSSNVSIVDGAWQETCDKCYKEIKNQLRSLKSTTPIKSGVKTIEVK